MLAQSFELIRNTFSEWSQDNASRLAAALAYYTTFSLAPLLVVVIAVAGLLGGHQAAQNQVMGQIQDLIGIQGRQFVQDMLLAASKPSTGLAATLLGAATLIFGALGTFSELQNSLNTIWDVKPKPARSLGDAIKHFLLRRIFSFTLVIGIGFLLLASLVISAALTALGQYVGGLNIIPEIIMQTINLIVSLLVITLLFMMIFKFLPEVKIAWRDVVLGAGVTSLLFNLGKLLIGLYLGHSHVATTFGAAGSLAIIMIWIYYSAQILFLGAEFTQVYANMRRREIEPDRDMEKIPEREVIEKGSPRNEVIAHLKHTPAGWKSA